MQYPTIPQDDAFLIPALAWDAPDTSDWWLSSYSPDDWETTEADVLNWLRFK